jgi:hypothetical protein
LTRCKEDEAIFALCNLPKRMRLSLRKEKACKTAELQTYFLSPFIGQRDTQPSIRYEKAIKNNMTITWCIRLLSYHNRRYQHNKVWNGFSNLLIIPGTNSLGDCTAGWSMGTVIIYAFACPQVEGVCILLSQYY